MFFLLKPTPGANKQWMEWISIANEMYLFYSKQEISIFSQ
jgi:hypothetical protein